MSSNPPVVLEGELEKILFSNEKEDYFVARFHPAGGKPVTLVGNLHGLVPGQPLKVHGEWVEHARFGRQLRVTAVESDAPATLTGIRKFLASGILAGIGPGLADRIVKEFGQQTFDVLDNNPEMLRRVPGIGRGRIEKIRKEWQHQRQAREVMVYLQSHGVGTALAVRIFASYGSRAIEVVRNRPYSLAMDIYGIGFLKADEIARQVGVPRESPQRAEAGLLHVLRECGDDGHVCYQAGELLRRAEELLQIGLPQVTQALEVLVQQGRMVIEKALVPNQDPDSRMVYLASLYASETGVAFRLKEMLGQSCAFAERLRALSGSVWQDQGFTPGADQTRALQLILQSKLSVLTGGPGTGKTTLLKLLISLLLRARLRVALAAPTGRASRRLAEATGQEARTIHRLLEYNRGTSRFTRDRETPLDADYVVIDEASMVDTVLMYHLLRAVPDHAGVLFVGDADQLPAVGAGNVLCDLIESRKIPTAELKEIFRQAGESRIVTNAHRINAGQLPEFDRPRGPGLSDFYFIEEEDSQKVLGIIRQLLLERIPKRFGLDPVLEVQVLAPMHRGDVGAEALNTAMRDWLNGQGQPVGLPGGEFRIGDKVMQVRNNYDREVFNGDIGRIRGCNAATGEVEIHFDSGPQTYALPEMNELAPAYAITVHKSQGSEYPAVILPLLTCHYMMLQRNLLYTAVTRARQLMVIVGSQRALSMAIGNNRLQRRCSLLAERLRSETV